MNYHSRSRITRRIFLRRTALISTGIAFGADTARPDRRAKPKPNILYLMTDQHRGDCLGCAGNKVIKTPHLDSIAADGVV
ncbi:MAG: hypothetical protein ACYSWW_22645, partial [Planctomycetota bacterium]